MNFWQKISPNYIPPQIAQKGELAILREKILQSLLLVLCSLGAPVIILTQFNTAQQNSRPLIIAFAVIYAIGLFIALNRGLPYSLRGHVLTLLIYLLAVSQLFEEGEIGDVRLFLVVFTALTSILFERRNIIAATALSVATILIVGLYATLVPQPIFPILANIGKDLEWIISAVTMLMISSVISIAISTIISGLQRNMIKQGELAQNLETERDALEGRVQERTRSMARQMIQLRTAAEISRSISALNNPAALMQQVVDLVKDRFELYYVGIFLLDAPREYAVLQAGTGEAGKQMIAQAHRLSITGSSMIGWAISNRKARIALDVGSEAVWFNNPNLPLTRSELALPIIAHDHSLGALTIQSDRPNAFDENDITILNSIADSLAIALENDQLFNQTRENLEEIRALNREYLQRVWAETIEMYGELAYDFNNPLADNRKAGKTVQLPLVLRDEVIGEISLELDQESLSEDEAAFVNNVTTQTAIALENARLLQETERRAIQEQKLNELGSRFARATSIDEILRAAAQELGQLPAVADVSVQLNPAIAPSRASSPSIKTSGGANGKERIV